MSYNESTINVQGDNYTNTIHNCLKFNHRNVHLADLQVFIKVSKKYYSVTSQILLNF
jgi:hypothetical protein